MSSLLIVHHTPSPTMHELLDGVRRGTDDPALSDVDVSVRPALSAGATDLLAADAILLGTPVNIGTLSGALKHFFDQIWYPALEATRGLPWGLWVHGNDNTAGAVRDVTALADGLGWQQVAAPVELVGPATPEDMQQVTELAQTVAASTLSW